MRYFVLLLIAGFLVSACGDAKETKDEKAPTPKAIQNLKNSIKIKILRITVLTEKKILT